MGWVGANKVMEIRSCACTAATHDKQPGSCVTPAAPLTAARREHQRHVDRALDVARRKLLGGADVQVRPAVDEGGDLFGVGDPRRGGHHDAAAGLAHVLLAEGDAAACGGAEGCDRRGAVLSAKRQMQRTRARAAARFRSDLRCRSLPPQWASAAARCMMDLCCWSPLPSPSQQSDDAHRLTCQRTGCDLRVGSQPFIDFERRMNERLEFSETIQM
jgi:hypothetical protein